MELGDTVRQLAHDFCRAFGMARLALKQLVERAAMNKLSGGERPSGKLHDRENGNERGMKQADQTIVEMIHVDEKSGGLPDRAP